MTDHIIIFGFQLPLGLIFFGVPMVMYVLQGVGVYWQEGRYGMALCVCAYALANVGLILDLFGI